MGLRGAGGACLVGAALSVAVLREGPGQEDEALDGGGPFASAGSGRSPAEAR